MKYAVLFISAILLFTACKKKKEPLYCYICVMNNSTTSQDQTYVNPHQQIWSDTLCNYNYGMIITYERDHTYKDTFLYNGITLVWSNWTANCTQN